MSAQAAEAKKVLRVPDFASGISRFFSGLTGIWAGGRGQKRLVLEIGDAWLKMAFVQDGPSPKILKYHCEPIRDLGELEISQKIDRAVKSRGMMIKNLILIHPDHQLTTRILSLPSTDRKEIADIIDLQAVKQTPYSREEITSGFSVLEQDATGYSKVLVAISHRDVVTRFFRMAELAGLPANQVCTSLEGIQNWYQTLLEQRTELKTELVALLDVDYDHSDFVLFQGANLAYSRSIAIGAKQIQDGGLAAQNDFAKEVLRSMESGAGEMKEAQVARVLVTGAQNLGQDVVAVLSREFNLACEMVSALKLPSGLFHAHAMDDLETAACSLVSVTGFAVKSAAPKINLIPSEIQLRKELEEKARDLTTFGALLLALISLLSVIALIRVYEKNHYLGLLKQEYKQIEPEAIDIERQVAKMRLAQDQRLKGGGILDVMKEVTETLPENMTLTFFQFQGKEKTVNLRGVSEEMSSVFQLLSTLESTRYLEFVKTKNVTKRKLKDKEMVEFEIVAHVADVLPEDQEGEFAAVTSGEPGEAGV